MIWRGETEPAGRVGLKPFITTLFAFADAAGAFLFAEESQSQALRVVIAVGMRYCDSRVIV